MVRSPQFHCRGHGFHPGWGTKILQATGCGRKREKIILFVDDVTVYKKTKEIYKNNPLALIRRVESDRTESKSIVYTELLCKYWCKLFTVKNKQF